MIADKIVAYTDYLLALCVLIFALYFFKKKDSDFYNFLFLGYFISQAVAAFLGGIFHEFHLLLSTIIAYFIWILALLFIGISNSFGLCILGYYSHKENLSQWIRVSCFICFTYIIMILIFPHFYIQTAYALISETCFVYLSLKRFVQTKNPNWAVLGLANLLGITTNLQQFFKLEIDPTYFSHNAIFHLLALIALTLFFIAGKNLKKYCI